MQYLGKVQYATRMKAEEVLAALEKARGKQLTHTWGKGSSSEHATGRAVDFMVSNDRAAGDFIADYVWANRVRLNLEHIIWRQRIISTRISPGVWRRMATRKNGDPTENHMDHPHVLFGPGPYIPPAGTGSPTARLDEDGDLGPLTIRALEHYVGGSVNASLDRMDVRAVQTWLGRERTGVLSERDIKAMQTKVGADVDGDWGPNTTLGLQKFLNRRNGHRQ